jgi:tRNA-specific 2-thiouridylase
VNFERQFNEQVIANFIDEYATGRTPLPCAHCNSDLKFATLAERAAGLGAEAVATGHYARVERDADGERYSLRRGVDPGKDQSYFLFSLTQAQLARAVFPIGHRPKDEVRDYARRRGLPVADKPDSQEICFIPDHDYRAFVTKSIPRRPAKGSSSTSRAACWAATRASIASPSGSGRALRSLHRRPRRCTCSRCARRINGCRRPEVVARAGRG